MRKKLKQTGVEGLRVKNVEHLAVVTAFCKRIGLVKTLNKIIPTNMTVDLGTMVLSMVLDTLSGRSPLYRLSEFIEEVDVETLLGRNVPSCSFNDTSMARAMDVIYEYGTEKLFSQLAFSVLQSFPLNFRHIHFDTTSVNVWGNYDMCGKKKDPDSSSINVTNGHSKDKRPDLKQFMIKMLCVKRNIPILGRCEDGNASDKTLNKNLLSRISGHMSKYGLRPGAFVYIGDSALVTPDNLSALGDNLFISRLPFSYSEADRVVADTVRKNNWVEVGVLAKTPETRKRPSARYRVSDQEVFIEGKRYRAVVAHSSAHDKRRLKKVSKRLDESGKIAEKSLKEVRNVNYFCRPDAEAAMRRVNSKFEFHNLNLKVDEKPVHAKGRPPKHGKRKVVRHKYNISGEVVENIEVIRKKREEAGCFVLLTNILSSGKGSYSPKKVLAAYKEQHGIERNFSFLKDPVVVNDTFFKRPERIEALGFILLTALLVWNLMEHTMREFIEKTNSTLPGWDGKMTDKPTSFMMSTKFHGLKIVRIGDKRFLAECLNKTQIAYLKAFGMSNDEMMGFS